MCYYRITSLFSSSCQPLKQVSKNPYLGIILDIKIYAAHISHITSKATRMLNIAAHLVKDITAIEGIQRCATHWVTSNFDWKNVISITLKYNSLLSPNVSRY